MQDEDKTQEMKTLLSQGPRTFFKVVIVRDNFVRSPYYTNYHWKVGENMDSFGLHVFLEREPAESLARRLPTSGFDTKDVRYAIIEAQGALEDFLAAGVDDSDLSLGAASATFKKLTVAQL